MRAFGLLMFLAAIFIIFNASTIREVLQGKTRINLTTLGTKNTSTIPSSKTSVQVNPDGSRVVSGSF